MTQGTIKRIYDNSDDRGHNFGLYFAEPENVKAYVKEDMSNFNEGDVIEYTIDSVKEGQKGEYANVSNVKLANANSNGSAVTTTQTKKPYQEIETDKSEDMFVMGFIGRFVENGHITLEQINQNDSNLSATLKNLRNAWRKSKE